MRIYKKLILSALAALALCQPAVEAQNGTITPYSRLGYGLLNDHASSSQRAMGGVGYAMNSGRQINSMNPASYAAIDTLTFLFDVGVTMKQLWSEEDGKKGKNFTGGLDYLTMQFPLGKYMGGSVGLLPYSTVGYSFGDEIVNGESSHQGSGAVNELYLGLSGRLFKGMTIGANVSYLFGTLLNDTYLQTNTSSSSLFERVVQIRDYDLRFGAQYSFNAGSKNRLTVGLVYSPGKDFRGKTYGVFYDINSDAVPDTIGYTRLNGKYSRPATYGAGISYHWNNRLLAEVDFTYQPWKDVKYAAMEGFERSMFDNRWKVALGLQYTPDMRGGYFKRVNYRLGGYLNHDYVMADGNNNVKDYGITMGLGLPAPINRLTKTVVNIGFEYRRRQSSPVKLVSEDYFQVTIGVNFNELWFWQNKIQ